MKSEKGRKALFISAVVWCRNFRRKKVPHDLFFNGRPLSSGSNGYGREGYLKIAFSGVSESKSRPAYRRPVSEWNRSIPRSSERQLSDETGVI